jgi:hypothetical protein
MSPSDETYASLAALEQSLKEKWESLSAQLQEIETDLKSVTRSLNLLGRRNDFLPKTLIFPPEQVKGLTHEMALERIAKANNGRFKLIDAKKVFVAAGKISNPKNAYSILAGTIRRGNKFHKVGVGEYELNGWRQGSLQISAVK